MINIFTIFVNLPDILGDYLQIQIVKISQVILDLPTNVDMLIIIPVFIIILIVDCLVYSYLLELKEEPCVEVVHSIDDEIITIEENNTSASFPKQTGYLKNSITHETLYSYWKQGINKGIGRPYSLPEKVSSSIERVIEKYCCPECGNTSEVECRISYESRFMGYKVEFVCRECNHISKSIYRELGLNNDFDMPYDKRQMGELINHFEDFEEYSCK